MRRFAHIVNVLNKRRRTLFSISVIFLGISIYELMKLNLDLFFGSLKNETVHLGNIWNFGSIIGASALGFLSDRFTSFSWRKPITICSMLFSILTLLLLFSEILPESFYPLVVFLNGSGATYIGVSRAFFLDQSPHHRRILAFIGTIIAQCITWVIVGTLIRHGIATLSNITFTTIASLCIILILTIIFASDNRNRDPEGRHIPIELSSLSRKFINAHSLSLIASFLFLSIGYHIMPYTQEYQSGMQSNMHLDLFERSIDLFGWGVAIGALFSICIKTPTNKSLPIGYGIGTIFLLGSCYLRWRGLGDKGIISWNTLLFFATIGGTLWVLTLKDFLASSSLSEDGAILGVFESTQSIGEGIGSKVASVIESKKSLHAYSTPILLLVTAMGLIFSIISKYSKKIRKR